MSTHTSDPRCRPPPAPVPVSDGQKAISPNHSHPGPGWLPSRPAAERRVKAACVWCGSSRFIHRIALDLRNIAAGNGDESQVGSEMSRRRFFRGTNLTGHLCFWKHGTLGPPPRLSVVTLLLGKEGECAAAPCSRLVGVCY